MPFRSLTRDRLTRALSQVLDEEHAAQARAFGAVLRAEDGAEHAADLLEQHVDQGV
ncbi:hypothetical protein ACFPJ1_11280 [Kribbella qitaiheensis]|uniref:hypothetical protein n=1 Tax=Kribbella qitaiheensis TaxID=1544730 RepID=UPI003624595F